MIVYIVTGHSKLKTLAANIALQCIKTKEAAALNPNYVICKNGLVRILMVINLDMGCPRNRLDRHVCFAGS